MSPPFQLLSQHFTLQPDLDGFVAGVLEQTGVDLHPLLGYEVSGMMIC